MVFHWSLSDSKSPQISRTRLSILAVLSNAVVWIVSTRPPTFKSSRPFNNHFVTVPYAPILFSLLLLLLLFIMLILLILNLKIRGVYYSWEMDVNIFFSSMLCHICIGMTKFKLCSWSKWINHVWRCESVCLFYCFSLCELNFAASLLYF